MLMAIVYAGLRSHYNERKAYLLAGVCIQAIKLEGIICLDTSTRLI